ncbi:hypothetical protein ABE099_12045 [Paenibacillus turicensis]|uniref:hypothetical protein n=1 Tax=Paenibacillus turicensis TaxID=160487 RepID=UPI003D299876
MFKIVENEEERLIFNQIWTQAWVEKGFELEYFDEVLDQCLIFDEHRNPVATVEIKPYHPKYQGGLDEIAPFHKQASIQSDPNHIAEVDKVAILQENRRGKNLDRLLAAIVLYAEQNNIHHYVTLLEPILFRALKVSYHVPMSRVGEKIFYKGDYVIPAIIHAEQFYKAKETYPWFMDVCHSVSEPIT